MIKLKSLTNLDAATLARMFKRHDHEIIMVAGEGDDTIDVVIKDEVPVIIKFWNADDSCTLKVEIGSESVLIDRDKMQEVTLL